MQAHNSNEKLPAIYKPVSLQGKLFLALFVWKKARGVGGSCKSSADVKDGFNLFVNKPFRN